MHVDCGVSQAAMQQRCLGLRPACVRVLLGSPGALTPAVCLPRCLSEASDGSQRDHPASSNAGTAWHMLEDDLPRMSLIAVTPLGVRATPLLSCIPAAFGRIRSNASTTCDVKRDSAALQRDASAASLPCTAAAAAACSRQRAAAALARGSSSVMALQIGCTCPATSTASVQHQVHMPAVPISNTVLVWCHELWSAAACIQAVLHMRMHLSKSPLCSAALASTSALSRGMRCCAPPSSSTTTSSASCMRHCPM